MDSIRWRMGDSDDAAVGGKPGLHPNRATETGQRVVAAFAARDYGALAALFSDRYTEQIEGADPLPREQVLAGLRGLFAVADASLEIEPIATLGDRLQLHRTRIAGASPDGAAIEYVSVIEVNDAGQLLGTEAFAPEHLDAATEQMRARHAASTR